MEYRTSTQSSDELLSYFASGELDAVRPMDDGQAGRGATRGCWGVKLPLYVIQKQSHDTRTLILYFFTAFHFNPRLPSSATSLQQ